MGARSFDTAAFDRAAADLVTGNRWQEEPQYSTRYRSRYEALIRRFAELVPSRPADVLDVGGGQLAFLAVALWDDRGCVVDCTVDLEHYTHRPNARGDRVLAAVGAPLRRIPRYRDNLLAVGIAP